MTQHQLSSSQFQTPTYTKAETHQLSLCKVFSTGCLYASTLTVLTQQSNSFKQHWTKISQHRFIQIEKFKLNQKKFHKVKSKLWQNIGQSFNTKTDSGILYYMLHQVWIPYIHQRCFMFLFVDSDNWIQNFMTDLNEFRQILSEYLMPLYSKEIIMAQDIIQKMFEVLVETMTEHKKWEKVDEVIVRIVSRLKNRLRVNQHTSYELFQLQPKQFPDINFAVEVGLLKSIYSNPSLKVKKQKLKLFNKLVYEKFYYKQIKPAIQYCFLLTGLDGFSQMLEFISIIGQFEDKPKEEIDSLKIIADNLLSRDPTGFTNYKIESTYNQNILCKKSWKFLFNRRSQFNFINPLKISHTEPTWQTAISWNYLKPNCQIPISVNVKNNFVKIGFITDNQDLEDCRDYTRSDKAVMYCLSTGIFYKNGLQSKHTSFKKHPITDVKFKIKDCVVSLEVTDKQGTKQVISYLSDSNILSRSKMIIIFRKGSLEVFPHQK